MPEPGGERTLGPVDLCLVVRGFAHEVRNHLTAIKGAVHLLELRQRPQGEAAELHASIHAEIGRVDGATEALRSLVLLEARQPAAVRVDRAVAAAVEASADAALLRSVTVAVDAGAAASVLVDPDQLEAAVRELLANAVRLSPAGARVRVSWRLLEPAALAVDVEDQGPGISAELEGRLMRPFFSTSEHRNGLGLKLVARVAALAGGELRWANLAPTGARFSLVLPRV